MKRYRVTRTIVMEGDEKWLDASLAHSVLAPHKPLYVGERHRLLEKPRVWEELLEDEAQA